MQIALSEIQSFCSESQKLHYSDLLSLAEDFDEDAKYQVRSGSGSIVTRFDVVVIFERGFSPICFQRNLRQHSRRGGSSTTLTPPPSVSPSSSSSSQHNFSAITNFQPTKSASESSAGRSGAVTV